MAKMTKAEFRQKQEEIRNEYYKEKDRLAQLQKEEEASHYATYLQACKVYHEQTRPIREKYQQYEKQLSNVRQSKLAKLTKEYGGTERAIRFLENKGFKVIEEESVEPIQPTASTTHT